MIIVLNATIGTGIWLPFTIGKSLALLSVCMQTVVCSMSRLILVHQQLDPRRLLYILNFPLRAIRVVTDPAVDFFMFLLSRLIAPLLRRAVSLCLAFFVRTVSSFLGEKKAEECFRVLSVVVSFHPNRVFCRLTVHSLTALLKLWWMPGPLSLILRMRQSPCILLLLTSSLRRIQHSCMSLSRILHL